MGNLYPGKLREVNIGEIRLLAEWLELEMSKINSQLVFRTHVEPDVSILVRQTVSSRCLFIGS